MTVYNNEITPVQLAIHEQWDAPQLFSEVRTPPIETRYLPTKLRNFIDDLSRATETPPEMAMAMVLASVSVAVTGKYAVSPKLGWVESLNCYFFVELPPANLKTKVVKSCTAPLLEWEMRERKALEHEIKKAKARRLTEEAKIAQLRKDAAKANGIQFEQITSQIQAMENNLSEVPILPQLFTNNVTPESLENALYEQGGVFAIISDEGGVIETLTGLYSNGRANVDVILKGIDGGDIRTKRKDRDIIMRPYLVIALCAQPIIRERMGQNKSLFGNGSLERFLYVIPHSKVGNRTHNQPSQQGQYTDAYHNLILDFLDVKRVYDDSGNLVPRIIELAPDAFRIFHDFQCWLEPQLKPHGELFAIQGWAGKIAGFTLRIAGIIHLTSGFNEQDSISSDTMGCAIEIAKGLIEHAKVAFLLMGWEPHQRDAKRICEWILSAKLQEFTRSELTHAMRHHIKSAQIDTALEELKRRHILREGGHSLSRQMYEVNPDVLRG